MYYGAQYTLTGELEPTLIYEQLAEGVIFPMMDEIVIKTVLPRGAEMLSCKLDPETYWQSVLKDLSELGVFI
jgi:hypothetical protein